MKLLVIAAGGTGGHMFPAQALAEEMLERNWRVVLSTDERGAKYAGNFPEAVERQVLSSGTFARGGLVARVAVPFRIAGGVLSARRRFRGDRPAVVAGFGGYPSIPALAAAGLAGIPRLIHEQNGVLGRVNRLFARRVQAVACGTWPTQTSGSAVDVGNPIRAAVKRVVGAPYDPSGPILVIGGSQGARTFADVVPAAIAKLADEVRRPVAQQARPEDLQRVSRAYADLGVAATVSTFFDDVPQRLAAASLVVSRAGASSIADISAVGRPAILVPYAAAMDDHQTANAAPLEQSGAARTIPESAFNPQQLADALSQLLSNSDRLRAMASASAGRGRPDASRALADLVETLGADQ